MVLLLRLTLLILSLSDVTHPQWLASYRVISLCSISRNFSYERFILSAARQDILLPVRADLTRYCSENTYETLPILGDTDTSE